ncbi:MAG TPA: DUF523 domain-containing protein [Smithella sp.]|nr:DUF523 domain-containing protein [Smithella sp.]
MKKFKIGISSCLLGEKVRYDGGHKLNTVIKDALGEKHIDCIPVCPEVECGLGVPRKLMQLEGNPDSPRLIIISTREDMTKCMMNWTQKRVNQLEKENICGFIFKSNSPSCGRRMVKIFNEKHMHSQKGVGIFARIFMEHFPLLPVEDDKSLYDPTLREIFFEQILAFTKSCQK